MRRPDNLDRARAACATREVVDQFYTLLDGTLEALRLLHNNIHSPCSRTAIYQLDHQHLQPTPEEHPLVAEGLIPRDLAALLPPIQRRPVRRLPVAARVITATLDYEHQYLERVEKERAGNADRQRRTALKRQREMERAAAACVKEVEETIEAVNGSVGTTTSDSGNTISPSLCDSLGAQQQKQVTCPSPRPFHWQSFNLLQDHQQLLQPIGSGSSLQPAALSQHHLPCQTPPQDRPPLMPPPPPPPPGKSTSRPQHRLLSLPTPTSSHIARSLRDPGGGGVLGAVQPLWVCVQWVVDNLREDKDYFCSYCSLK
ncbi:hypothetical protein SKAU_G00191660 [Synaphobranchus kaupii]|uniref:Uncharacterized protein n=1 Tax=Synaphobranchus kaupii TaxID=118154 RepID=A0A9Q1FDU3_SYNKA|nr:hypothetical protein SKAU_G00191660 [Synaphobranchus kaupii]